MAESDAQAHKLWSEEHTKASSELAEVQEAVKKQADRVERLTCAHRRAAGSSMCCSAPPGEVVRPAKRLCEIVPLGDALVAEVYVKPDDIAAVKVDDKAELKVTAYDFSKYGKMKGEVSAISPTTTENEDKRSYYKVMILSNPYRSRIFQRMAFAARDDGGRGNHLGSKSLLQYVLEADPSWHRCCLHRTLTGYSSSANIPLREGFSAIARFRLVFPVHALHGR